MHPQGKREEVISLIQARLSDREISRRTGVSRSTVRNWRLHGLPQWSLQSAPLPEDWRPPDPENYAYLLGIYLGDGHVSRHGKHSFGINLYLDLAHPTLIDEAERALRSIFSQSVGRWRRPGTNCVRLSSYGPNWPFVFPQHGPGPKHKRKIELVEWQREIVGRYPREFLRGLIHSDGCRCVNEFTVQLKGGPRRYSYVRYFFSNRSEDIKDLFCEACDLLGIKWSRANPRHVSVSNRASVAILEGFIGPKR